jgi:hypothetical protein
VIGHAQASFEALRVLQAAGGTLTVAELAAAGVPDGVVADLIADSFAKRKGSKITITKRGEEFRP